MQPVRVQHQAHRAQRHRQTRDHRAQQPAGERVECAGGHRNADDVVAERPPQILADVAHRGVGQVDGLDDAAQVAAHQGHVRRLHRHVRAGADGDAEIRLGQRGGVVDAVAHHRNQSAGLRGRAGGAIRGLGGGLVAFALQFGDPVGLAVRLDLADHRIDADFAGDAPGYLGLVAR